MKPRKDLILIRRNWNILIDIWYASIYFFVFGKKDKILINLQQEFKHFQIMNTLVPIFLIFMSSALNQKGKNYFEIIIALNPVINF